MQTREEKILYARVIPPVAELSLTSKETFRLEDGCRFVVSGADANCVIADARRAWGILPQVDVLPAVAELKPEAYGIEVNADCVRITASTQMGVRHAMKTLRQLADSERGVLTHTHYILPFVQIQDAPELDFRGIHLCWFPETPVWEIEKQIRIAAYYKYSHVVIESWGVIRLKSCPEYVWQEYAVEQEEVRRLVRLGEELGITIFPQVNLFGHAAASRTQSGKHVLLDFHPEYAPLFESDGWTWCLSNPATRQYLTDMVLEMHELFGNPPYFHIGCDEAYDAASCTSCRQSDYAALLKDHLLYFRDLLQQRGARIMMWHDMLLLREDERWKDYIVYGRAENGLEHLYQELPRDIIICDWQYGYPEVDGKEPHWPTTRFFKENGFDVLVCPWFEQRGTQSLCELVVRERMMGMLVTSWCENRGYRMYQVFYTAIKASWGTFRNEIPGCYYHEFFNRHLREIGRDMKITEYIQAGRAAYQMNPQYYLP